MEDFTVAFSASTLFKVPWNDTALVTTGSD